MPVQPRLAGVRVLDMPLQPRLARVRVLDVPVQPGLQQRRRLATGVLAPEIRSTVTAHESRLMVDEVRHRRVSCSSQSSRYIRVSHGRTVVAINLLQI